MKDCVLQILPSVQKEWANDGERPRLLQGVCEKGMLYLLKHRAYARWSSSADETIYLRDVKAVVKHNSGCTLKK